MDAKSFEPKQTSETRFIVHEHKVQSNQFHNWPIKYKFWEKRAAEYLEEVGDDEKVY